MRSRIASVVVGLVAMAGCGGPSVETTTTATAAEPTTTSPAGSVEEGVSTADTDLGAILVGPDGFTLYVFTPDNGGDSTCYGDCAAIWPPVPGDTPSGPGVDASMFGTTTRDDGTEQLTVNGWPLYRFTPDSAPGDVNGQGIEGVWFVVDASGEMVVGLGTSGGSAPGSDSTVPDPEYGY